MPEAWVFVVKKAYTDTVEAGPFNSIREALEWIGKREGFQVWAVPIPNGE